MLRITVCHGVATNRFVIEGKLAGDSVSELEKCWEAAMLTESSILVDLMSVTFIDVRGKQLLARMHQNGAELIATGLMTKCIVEDIEKRESEGRESMVNHQKAREPL
jgi:hypothetical protein